MLGSETVERGSTLHFGLSTHGVDLRGLVQYLFQMGGLGRFIEVRIP